MAFAARPLSLMVSSASLAESWTVCGQACTIQTSHGQVMAKLFIGDGLFGLAVCIMASLWPGNGPLWSSNGRAIYHGV